MSTKTNENEREERDEHAAWRKSDTIADLENALLAAKSGHWGRCRTLIAEADESAKKWEHAADVFQSWTKNTEKL